jgi:hypothetical protein
MPSVLKNHSFKKLRTAIQLLLPHYHSDMSAESPHSVISQPQPAQGPQSDSQSPSASQSEDQVSSSETPQSPLMPVPSMETIEKIVLFIVATGIIVFAVFQLLQCVTSYANPVTKSTVLNVTRTYPGLMICPFSNNIMPSQNSCPQWSSDAYLSYDFNDYDSTGSTKDYGNPTIARSCPWPLVVSLENTNTYRGSNPKRTQLTCRGNWLSNFFGGSPLAFGSYGVPLRVTGLLTVLQALLDLIAS